MTNINNINHTHKDGNDSFVRRLNETILRCSDDPSGHPPGMPITAETSLIRTFTPKNLEAPFQELHSILYPCLRPRLSSSTSSSSSLHDEATTASAILMGPRGSGKSLLVDRCLEACRQVHGSKFRKVVVNGIVVRGGDVPSVVYEIIRQLSDIALTEAPTGPSLSTAAVPPHSSVPPLHRILLEGDDESQTHKKRRRGRNKGDDDDEYILRLRKSTFTSNLALLESTLKMAEVDRIPIVLVLDELDSFILPSNNHNNSGGSQQQHHRQLLLYHLLDRVATPGSNLALIGLTSNFTALTQMEKRIRSRAEGTSKIVYVRPPGSYDQLVMILQDKLHGCPVVRETTHFLLSTDDDSNENNDKDNDKEEAGRLQQTFQREFRMGRDVRWFCRVLCAAISLYRFDCVLTLPSSATDVPWIRPKFTAAYFIQALAMTGSFCLTDSQAISATKQSNLCLEQGVAVDPRLQASLLDLSQSQVALLLAAKRILAREAHLEHSVGLTGETAAASVLAPLTLQRMIHEYQSFRRGVQSYSDELLTVAAHQLLERGVLVPSLDHSGAGPMQYHVSLSFETLDPYSLSRLPLHFPTDLNRELDEALKQNLMNCSTALNEWGRKTN